MQRIRFSASFIHFFLLLCLYYILSTLSNYTFSFVRSDWRTKNSNFPRDFIMLNQFCTWKLNQQQFASLHNFHHHHQQIPRINATLLNFYSICAVIFAWKHITCMIICIFFESGYLLPQFHAISLFVESCFYSPKRLLFTFLLFIRNGLCR